MLPADRRRNHCPPPRQPSIARPRPRRLATYAPRKRPGHGAGHRPPRRCVTHVPLSKPHARQLVTEATIQANGRRAEGPTAEKVTAEASWRERALNTEAALKAAYAEINRQRGQIGELLGRIRDLQLDLPDDAIQRLVIENTTLEHQIRTLTADNKTLGDRLAAARNNNRAQDQKIARPCLQRIYPAQNIDDLRHDRKLGGTTGWKLGPAAAELSAEARARGLTVHMGRVNSLRRLRYAASIGCESTDGTCLTYAPGHNLPRLLSWLNHVNRSDDAKP